MNVARPNRFCLTNEHTELDQYHTPTHTQVSNTENVLEELDTKLRIGCRVDHNVIESTTCSGDGNVISSVDRTEVAQSSLQCTRPRAFMVNTGQDPKDSRGEMVALRTLTFKVGCLRAYAIKLERSLEEDEACSLADRASSSCPRIERSREAMAFSCCSSSWISRSILGIDACSCLISLLLACNCGFYSHCKHGHESLGTRVSSVVRDVSRYVQLALQLLWQPRVPLVLFGRKK